MHTQHCIAEHHTPAHGHLEVITTSKRLQPVTTKFIDDQGTELVISKLNDYLYQTSSSETCR